MAKRRLMLTAEAVRRRTFLRQAGMIGAAAAFGQPGIGGARRDVFAQ